jgi:gliding motility-associated-like protein
VFDSGTTSYTASVPNSVTGITLTPTFTDNTATITVNGIAVTSGIASGNIPLAVGPNTITTTVTAQDGTTMDTYTVIVTRAPSSVATLSNLVLSQGALTPTFDSATTGYTANVPFAVTAITLTPTFTDNTASITVNGIAVASGTPSSSIPLAIGPNTITTVVTAQDGVTTDTYTIVVTRALSADATLSNLTISQGTLTPVFDSATASYTAAVPNSVTGITEIPTVTDANATITVNGVAVASGTASGNIPLVVGPNTITTIVTAQDGTTTKTYTVVVTRAASSNAALMNLTVSEGKLTPSFSSGTLAYADSVSNSISSITVTPTVSDNTATITVNGKTVSSGTASDDIPLAPGNNTITVLVTAQDGVTTNTYTVTVYRGIVLSNLDANNVLTPNGDGKNDHWVIKDIQLYPQNNVNIFDRGGRLVYSKHGYTNDWDGTYNGSPLVQGTYYYVVDLGPDLPKFKGFISIIRN